VLLYNTPLTSQTANIELGQPDFLHNTANTVDAEGLYNPAGIAIDGSNHLYVVDYNNNRILGYTSTSFANDAPANLVIGQPGLYSAGCNQGIGASNATLCHPWAVATDNSSNLYVSDMGNNRVLEYTAPFSQGKSSGFTATRVWGQSGSFASSNCDPGGVVSATTLCAPAGLAVDTHSNLYVADSSNNRVLEYASGSTAAAKEFGQGNAGTDLTHNTPNNGGLGASSLDDPYGVATDSSNNVYIADYSNNRVLEYNETANPPTNFTANKVFGQAGSFTTNGSNQGGLSSNSLYRPEHVSVDTHSKLYVADSGNDRLLEYNTPLTSGTTASTVFGQSDSFVSNSCNFGGGPSASSLCGPVGVALDSARNVLLGDFTNNRVLKYLQPFAATGSVTLAPSPEPFGSVAKSTTSVTRNVTATNTGLVPVLFTGLSITGTNAGDFKVVTNTCTGYVKAAAACTVGLSFTPTATAGTAESATLTIFDNASNANQTDSLTGTSAAQTTASPNPVTIGSVQHGPTSSPHVVTLANNQSSSITLSPAPGISFGSATFAISSTTRGASVAAGT
jgi:hypothetical protein